MPIATHTADAVSLLRRMVAVPSPTFEEEAVRNLVGEQLRAWGIDCHYERHNIIAWNRHARYNAPTLILCAHIDTVPPNAGYYRDPYDPGTDDDRIWGLGSNDDGGSVVAMIAAFRHFNDHTDLPFNILLALTCEEERSGAGGASWLWTHTDLLPPDVPAWAIIGEPTGGRAATSERGLLVLDGEAHGVSGHAARDEGVNALYIAMDDVSRLRNFDFDRVSPLMGNVKVSVTQMSCGTTHNVIPDSCRFVVDIRPTEQYSNAEILDLLQGVCQSTLTPRNLLNRSSATLPDSPFLPILDGLGIATFSSPTTSDWMRTPCDAIKMGPGDSSRSHRPDEFILVAEIEQAITDYISIINAFKP